MCNKCNADPLQILAYSTGWRKANNSSSPTAKQVLATASGDTTIKMWSVKDFACLATFEGHQSSVLRVKFLSRGVQLISAGSDGLIKLWNIKTNETVATIDAHDAKV